MLRGAAVGAVAGAVLDNDAGKGAAVGGLVGGVRNQKSQASAEADYQARLAAYDNNRAAWARAYGACMQSRGYTVK